MRIIAGKHKGRQLVKCNHLKSLRPTTDRNRESLFNIITSSKILKNIGFELKNANILDIFCGSGAVSLEALSRGAKSATLIDISYDHLQIAKDNALLLGEKQVEFWQSDALKITSLNNKNFDLIFIDPPYSKNIAPLALENLAKTSSIKEGTLIIIESSKKDIISLDEEEFKLLEKRNYGISRLSFYQKIASNLT